jgi:hypothetical protein
MFKGSKSSLLARKAFPKFFYWRDAKKRFFQQTRKKMDYRHPKDINEKLMWLTRYWQHPLKTRCADKYLVREFVKECGLGDILVPLIAVYNDADEIDFGVLPDSFVLKCNHGCGYNIIVFDKKEIDFESTRQQLDEWLHVDFSQFAYEIHYRDIPRKIVCEKLLDTSAPMEYQCWCINGEIDSILACRKNFDGSYDAWSYSTDWTHLCDRIGESDFPELQRPANLDRILEYAKILSKPFPFVRVDFYEVDNTVFFAELTFTPCSNILIRYKPEFVKRLGEKLILPQKFVPRKIAIE